MAPPRRCRRRPADAAGRLTILAFVVVALAPSSAWVPGGLSSGLGKGAGQLLPRALARPISGFGLPAQPSRSWLSRGRFDHGAVATAPSRLPGRRRRQAASVADYTGVAVGLFNSLRGVATFLAGAGLPLGFFAAPKPEKDDSPRLAWQKRVHLLIATETLCCLLTTVVFSTVSINKLTEVPVAKTTSVVQLLARDYELPWLGCNVNLFGGVMGFALLILNYSSMVYGPAGQVPALMLSATLCLMLGFVNQGIACGDGVEGGMRFSSNFAGLIVRYIGLLAHATLKSRGILFIVSFVLAALALVRAAKIVAPPSNESK